MNFIAAIIAGLIAFIIVGLWYSVLFGKAWQGEKGTAYFMVKDLDGNVLLFNQHV